jgi:hypothetical protein
VGDAILKLEGVIPKGRRVRATPRVGRCTNPKARRGRRGPYQYERVSAVERKFSQDSSRPGAGVRRGKRKGKGTDLASVPVTKPQVVVHAQEQEKGGIFVFAGGCDAGEVCVGPR